METRFRSAVDTWFYLLVAVTVVVNLFVVGQLLGGVSTGDMVLGILGVVIGTGLPVWLLAATWYEVSETRLLVKSGPFRWTIGRSEIHTVKPSRSLQSSPALSLDRLEIQYGRGRRLLVSPADRDGFVRALGFAL